MSSIGRSTFHVLPYWKRLQDRTMVLDSSRISLNELVLLHIMGGIPIRALGNHTGIHETEGQVLVAFVQWEMMRFQH